MSIKKRKNYPQKKVDKNKLKHLKIKNWAEYSRGLGKEIWQDIDVDTYIKDLRDEWDA